MEETAGAPETICPFCEMIVLGNEIAWYLHIMAEHLPVRRFRGYAPMDDLRSCWCGALMGYCHDLADAHFFKAHLEAHEPVVEHALKCAFGFYD